MKYIIYSTILSISILLITACVAKEDSEYYYIHATNVERIRLSAEISSIVDDCFENGSVEACEALVRYAEEESVEARFFVYLFSFDRNIFELFGGAETFLSVLPEHNRLAAFQELVALADEGYGPAQAFVGQILYTSRRRTTGIDADPERAIEYLQNATEADSRMAPLFLGFAYDEGIGVSGSSERATYFFELAFERREARAGIYLAQRAIAGEVVEQDLGYATQQLVRAAELDYVPAIEALCLGQGFEITIPMPRY